MLQQDGLELVSAGGGGLRQSRDHLVTIWPLCTTQNRTLLSPPNCPASYAYAKRPPKGSYGSWVAYGRESSWHLDSVRGPYTSWHLGLAWAQLNPCNPKPETAGKSILGCRDQSHKVSRGIWVTEMVSLEACRRNSHRGPAP